MRRYFLVFCTAIAMVVTGFQPVSTSSGYPLPQFSIGDAQAQAKPKKRRGLFSVLFGRKNARKKAVKPGRTRNVKRRATSRKKTRSRSRSRSRSASRGASAARVAAVAKSEDALKVLVVGDFLAGGMARGLARAYTAVPNITIVDKSNGLSGFVRSDITNWPERLPQLVEEIKPAYVVAMLGSNDRQLIREGGKNYKKRTPEWDTRYKARVDALGTALKATGLPYTWVGLPPMRHKRMNTDFVYFNGLYASAAEGERGKFVDVWDGFSDADGNYSRSGPDVRGQIVMLRPKDGINLNRAGRERLAFYVQDDIQKILTGETPTAVGLGSGPGFDLTPQLPKAAAYDPAKTGRTIVMRLNDPAIDGADILAGEKINLDGGPKGGFNIPLSTEPAPAVRKEGRVDNYRWPPVDTVPTPPARASAQNQ